MQMIRILGMVMVFSACAGLGLHAAGVVRRTVRQLTQLKLSLEMMQCEISYSLTPIGKLCGILSSACSGEIAGFYAVMEQKLKDATRSVPEAAKAAMAETAGLRLTPLARQSLMELFGSFGKFGSDEQLKLIALTQERISAELAELSAQKQSRCRCYEALGVCAGLAMVILVI